MVFHIDEKWYVMQVFGGEEFKTKQLCDLAVLNSGEEIFIPLYERKKRLGKALRLVKAPLFPGYVFFNTPDIEHMFFRLKKIPKLTKVLLTDNQFIPLDYSEINFIKQSGGDDHIFEMSYGYIEGDDIIITDGPMVNLQGKIKKINRHKRVAVLEVQFMNRITDITVGLEITKKLPKVE